MEGKLSKLLAACREEMGPEIYSRFLDDLAGGDRRNMHLCFKTCKQCRNAGECVKFCRKEFRP